MLLGLYEVIQDAFSFSAGKSRRMLIRAPFTSSTSRESSTARLGPHIAGARTLRRLPRPRGTGPRPVPPHCSRDLGHGPGVGSVASRERCGLGTFSMRVFYAFYRCLPATAVLSLFALRFSTVVSKRIVSLFPPFSCAPSRDGTFFSRRGTEYACDENALHRAYRASIQSSPPRDTAPPPSSTPSRTP